MGDEPAMDVLDGPGLVRLTRALSEAGSLEELEQRFVHGFGRLVDVPMFGFYALDEDGEDIGYNVGVNVSDVFVARYENAMHLDPLLDRARTTGEAVYNRAAMSAPEWEEEPIYRLAYSTHAMRHVAELPVTAAGEVVGALHFAASEPTRDFAATDFQTAEILSGALGVAIGRIRALGQSRRENERLRTALDLAGVAVAVSRPTAPELELNDAARRALGRIAGWEEHLHRLMTPPPGELRFSRRARVGLASGAEATLNVSADRLPGGDLVAVIELLPGHPELAADHLALLTPREGEVAALVVDGLTDREIASRLSLSHYTVSQHVKRVYRKLGVDSRVALTRLLTGRRP